MNEVESVLRDCDIDYTDRGGELWARCPMHKDRTGKEDRNPSWSINTRTGAHHCFSCGYSGNLYILLRDVKGEAVAFQFRADVETFGQSADVDTTLVKTRATAWVDSRKRSAKKRLGIPEVYLALYNPEIPAEALKARGINQDAVDVYEVMWDDENDAWVLPFWHPKGHLIGWQKKRDHWFKNEPVSMPKASTLFGWHQVKDHETVALVESPLDAVKMYSLGYPTLALAGSRASGTQEQLLTEFERVVLILDNDTAGKREQSRLREVLSGFTVAADYRDIPKYKDPGEMPDVIIDSLFAKYFV